VEKTWTTPDRGRSVHKPGVEGEQQQQTLHAGAACSVGPTAHSSGRQQEQKSRGRSKGGRAVATTICAPPPRSPPVPHHTGGYSYCGGKDEPHIRLAGWQPAFPGTAASALRKRVVARAHPVFRLCRVAPRTRLGDAARRGDDGRRAGVSPRALHRQQLGQLLRSFARGLAPL